MRTLGIVITDGVGFRNFVLSDFIIRAEESFDKVVIYSCLPKKVFDGFVRKAKVVELEVFKERFPTWFFMKLKEIAHFQLNKKGNFGLSYNLRRIKPKGWSNRAIAGRLIYAFTHFFHSERWIKMFNNLQRKTFKSHLLTQEYIRQINEDKPDLLFFTHQRPPYIAPVIYAANTLNIPTATFIFSWDNLASKGRMAGDFDHYLVWSDLMKQELLDFYETIDKKQIQVVGTPQFEPFVLDRYAMSKTDFLGALELRPGTKMILYSCGDATTSQNDPLYIETLAKALVEKKIPGDIELVVRTSPAETAERFKELAEKYSFIKWNVPDWPLTRADHQETWSQRVPSEQDMKILRALLQYSDLAINMCSTMSLDAMIFDKPVINPVFGNGKNGLYDDQRYLKYQHYERVVESGAVVIAKDKDELISCVREAIDKPDLRLNAQRKLLKLQISKELPGTSLRFVNILNSLCDPENNFNHKTQNIS